MAETSPRPRLDEIRAVVAAWYNLTPQAMTAPTRRRRAARPRQIAMALARDITGLSLPQIGRRFGGRDHTTVLWACRKVQQLAQDDAAFAADLLDIRAAVYRFVQNETRPALGQADTYLAAIRDDIFAMAAIFGEAKAANLALRRAELAERRRHRSPILVAA